MGKLVKTVIAIILFELMQLQLYVLFPETGSENIPDLSIEGENSFQRNHLAADSNSINSKSAAQYLSLDHHNTSKTWNISKEYVGNRSQISKRYSKMDSPENGNPASGNKLKYSKPVEGIRKWNNVNPILFIHIGKNGGTSFDGALMPIIKGLGGRYIGGRHFDWSQKTVYPSSDVAVMLREPVSRAISHFSFCKKLSWTVNSPIRQQSLTAYLRDPQTMLDTRDVWQDGQAAVSWLTGTHIASWVGTKPRDIPKRELLSLNVTQMCLLAAKRLEETLWFGFLEDVDRSMELLAYQLGYGNKITLSQSNKNRQKTTVVTDLEQETLASLMPQDLWLYSYAKLLFEARWTSYKTGVYVKPELPPIPQPECVSTRFALKCTDGPLAPLYFKGSAPKYHKYII